jgi:hypothetical protein
MTKDEEEETDDGDVESNKHYVLFHRLLAQHFIPVPDELKDEEKLFVGFINGKKNELRVDNLYWMLAAQPKTRTILRTHTDTEETERIFGTRKAADEWGIALTTLRLWLKEESTRDGYTYRYG